MDISRDFETVPATASGGRRRVTPHIDTPFDAAILLRDELASAYLAKTL